MAGRNPTRKLAASDRRATAVRSIATRVAHAAPRRAKRAVRALRPEVIRANRQTAARYRAGKKVMNGWRRSEESRAAVVVHLYYTEAWELLGRRLLALRQHLAFDLYVTLPAQNEPFLAQIEKDFPDVRAIVVPNRGRDVLPFMQVLPALQQLGYDWLLKLHSKKSTHRTDGQEWLGEMVEDLMPDTQAAVTRLTDVLDKKTTGIVGPAGQYVSLRVNFEANGPHMTHILNRIYGRKTSYEVLQARRAEHGFFGGTMFWARLDALRPVTGQRFAIRQYEIEHGQIDATFAHALERIFCLVAEIDGRQLYEIDNGALIPVAYDSGIVPDWSAVYIGPPAPSDVSGKP